MKPKLNISMEEIKRLKGEGWSHQRIAIHFKVSSATIKRRLRSDFEFDALRLAGKLDWIAGKAQALATEIRSSHCALDRDKKTRITESIRSGARELGEISEECELSRGETNRLLQILIKERRVKESEPGGFLTRGRRKKKHYILKS